MSNTKSNTNQHGNCVLKDEEIIKRIIGLLMVIAFLLVIAIKDVETTETGCQITFRDDTGYYIEF